MEEVRETEGAGSAFTLVHGVWVLTAIVVGLGLVLRLRGFVIGTIPLWEDEAAWATRLVELPVTAHDIRPLGFMALSKLLVSLLSPSEAVLRSLPWLAGIGALAMAPFLANRLFASAAARLLFIALIALHPAAIDLSKEFKPYSVGLAWHMASLLLALRFLDAGKLRDLGLLLALLFAGTLFTQDALITYPGLFGLLALRAYRARRSRQLVAVVAVGVMTVGLLVTSYLAFWRHSVGKETTRYWGNKYDVFYVKTPSESRRIWTVRRLGELAALPGMRRDVWQSEHVSDAALGELKQLDASVWQVLGVLGLGLLCYHRRDRELVLVVGPLAVLVAMNRFGLWPLGAFRTNLFALVYVAVLAATPLDRRSSAPSRWDFVPAAALVLLPFLLLGNTNRTKWAMASASAFPEALQALEGLRVHGKRDGRSTVVLDGGSCPLHRYYTRLHPDHAQLRRDLAHFEVHCVRDADGIVGQLRQGLTNRKSRAFAVVSRGRSLDAIQQNLPEDLEVDSEQAFGDGAQVVLRVRRRATR